MKVIIAGSRDFTDFEFLEKKLNELFEGQKHTIISGHARGVDKLGERYAEKHGLSCIVMPADWETYGKRAGYLRNVEMAKVADMCICFWDGVSKGTQHMINIAQSRDLGTVIINYKKEE